MEQLIIQDIVVTDLRFPTSLTKTGSDARSQDPDYSCVYLEAQTNNPSITGVATVFTLGRGNSPVVSVIENQKRLLIGQTLAYLTQEHQTVYQSIVEDGQLCWNGPEKGLCHQAHAGLINLIWDLWAKFLKKPLWQLISEMSPKALVKLLPLKYLTDILTNEKVSELFTPLQKRPKLTQDISVKGYPYYITCGWSGYSDLEITNILQKNIKQGVKGFKMKVGSNLHDDCRRASLIRQVIGTDAMLAMDANGVWEKNQAVQHLKQLKKYQPYWIEEPTHPDDILSHAEIAKQIKPILVATGEQCSNKIMFRQFLEADGLSILQTDIQRLAGVTEWLVVMLLAKYYGVKCCPHSGGVGLPEMTSHLCLVDYICFSGSHHGRYAEYVDCLSEHFQRPAQVKKGHYLPPQGYGIGLEMKSDALRKYSFPNGSYWSDPTNSSFLKQKGWR